MKKILSILSLVIGVIALLAFAAPAHAGSEFFNNTNVLGPNIGIAGWPTNSTGTNGIAALTGKALNVDNYTQVGLVIESSGGIGAAAGTTTGTIDVYLARAFTAGPPAATNFVSTPVVVHSFTYTTTNRLLLCTNLDATTINPASWIGCYLITNTGTNITFTNLSVYITKKIPPTRWP